MVEKIPPAYEDYFSRVGTRLASVRERIGDAAARAGRDSSKIEVVAVSKFHPVEAVEAALACGIRRFAESRVQEAEGKFPRLLPGNQGLRLDFIGHLQGNKVNRALLLFDRLQSIDSLELVNAIASKMRLLTREDSTAGMELLFELHTGEESKSGFPDADSLRRACELVAALAPESGIELRGLMTMAPLGAGEAGIRSSFGRLRSLRETLISEFAFPRFDVLSMGMSGDFEIAVEEGATEVRIGTAIFGERRQ